MHRPALAASITLLLAAAASAQLSWNPQVREVADFVLAQQTPLGCIPDAFNGLRAHEGAAMGRTLLAPAHAWRTFNRVQYRNAWRDGIRWLAVSMERQGTWNGTWRQAYAAKPPHVPLPSSPDGIAADARGLSAAAGLFAYHVALYTQFTGDETLSNACRSHVQAALDFALERNRAPNHLFYRAWVQPKGQETWELARKQFALDQADMLLGLKAGAWLLGHLRYRLAADQLQGRMRDLLFHKRDRAFGIALDEAGELLPPAEDAESYLIQGYLTWVLGFSRETEQAMKWLRERMEPDGSFRRRRGEPAEVLPVAAFCIGASRIINHANDQRRARRWLRDNALTPKGGIRASIATDAPLRNDLAALVILAWLGPDPLPFAGPSPSKPGMPIFVPR